jgi:hypothetical protein
VLDHRVKSSHRSAKYYATGEQGIYLITGE